MSQHSDTTWCVLFEKQKEKNHIQMRRRTWFIKISTKTWKMGYSWPRCSIFTGQNYFGNTKEGEVTFPAYCPAQTFKGIVHFVCCWMPFLSNFKLTWQSRPKLSSSPLKLLSQFRTKFGVEGPWVKFWIKKMDQGITYFSGFCIQF